MNKATLFDSFYVSYHNETKNYVADRPCCSGGGVEGGVQMRNIVFHFKKKLT